MLDPKRVAVSETELDIANSGPALLSNRFYVTVAPFGVRIAFTEQSNPKSPFPYRSSNVNSRWHCPV